MRHRERLPDSEHVEVVELSRPLNALYDERARDASLFRNPNGVYMKLANFRAVDPLHTSQGKRGLRHSHAWDRDMKRAKNDLDGLAKHPPDTVNELRLLEAQSAVAYFRA
jgi:CRISPR-associated protein Cas1